MSTRKTTLFYVLLTASRRWSSAWCIASRLDLAPASSAQTLAVPPMNSAPLTGPVDAQTFRNIAKAATPMVVNIRTEMKAKAQDLTDFFGGGGGVPDDPLHRFFGAPGQPDEGQQPPSGRGGGSGTAARADDARGRHRASSSARTASSSPTTTWSRTPIKIEVALFGDDTDVVLRREGRRPRSADRQRAHSADRQAEPRRCRKRSSAIPRRWRPATG